MKGEIDVEKTIEYIGKLKRMSEREALRWYWKAYWSEDAEGMERTKALYGETLERGLERIGVLTDEQA